MTIQDRLDKVQRLEDAKEKTDQYKKLLSEVVAAAAESDLKEYVDHSEFSSPSSGSKEALVHARTACCLCDCAAVYGDATPLSRPMHVALAPARHTAA